MTPLEQPQTWSERLLLDVFRATLDDNLPEVAFDDVTVNLAELRGERIPVGNKRDDQPTASTVQLALQIVLDWEGARFAARSSRWYSGWEQTTVCLLPGGVSHLRQQAANEASHNGG